MNHLHLLYLTAIYKAICQDKSTRAIHKEIRKITLAFKKENADFKVSNSEKYAFKIAKRVRNETPYGGSILDLSILAYTAFEQNKAYEKFKSISYDYANKVEQNAKEDLLKSTYKENQEINDKIEWEDKEKAKSLVRIFYLVSAHNDCAKDHLDYQGRIYIDEKWRSVIKDEEIKREIEDYIAKNNVLVWQKILYSPVWLITRPNCRHYFQVLTVNTVFNSTSTNSLLNKYNMVSSRGNRKYTQTIRHNTKSGWYSRENVENIIERYEERLDYHRSLNSVKANKLVGKAIQKDKLLIKKWKSYLPNL